jgi:hypothetical protein
MKIYLTPSTVTMQPNGVFTRSCFYIHIMLLHSTYQNVPQFLCFEVWKKKTHITFYQLCSTNVVNLKKDHINMQGWTLYFHNFKWQPSPIYDEAYFWHNDETHKLFLAPSHCFYSHTKKKHMINVALKTYSIIQIQGCFLFQNAPKNCSNFFLWNLIQMLLNKFETNVCMMFTLRLLNGAMSWGSVQYVGYFCFPIFA